MRDLTFRTPSLDDSRAIAEFQTVCWREAYVGVVPQDTGAGIIMLRR